MAKGKSRNTKTEDKEEKPKHLIREDIRQKHLAEVRELWDKFSEGMRVYRYVYEPVENTVFCKKAVKCGVIYSKIVNPGGLCQFLVLWDGDKVPVPEQPNLLSEEW